MEPRPRGSAALWAVAALLFIALAALSIAVLPVAPCPDCTGSRLLLMHYGSDIRTCVYCGDRGRVPFLKRRRWSTPTF